MVRDGGMRAREAGKQMVGGETVRVLLPQMFLRLAHHDQKEGWKYLRPGVVLWRPNRGAMAPQREGLGSTAV